MTCGDTPVPAQRRHIAAILLGLKYRDGDRVRIHYIKASNHDRVTTEDVVRFAESSGWIEAQSGHYVITEAGRKFADAP